MFQKIKWKVKSKKKNSKNHTYYSNKKEIYILTKYPLKNKDRELKGYYEKNLESLLEIEEQIEEELEELGVLRESVLEKLLHKPFSDEKYITPKDYRNNKIIYLNLHKPQEYLRSNQQNIYLNVNSKSGVSIFYVPPYTLPHGEGWRALGMYDPSTHSIYIANDLTSYEERFVYHHEIAHALGIRDENLADQYAASKVGYNLRQAA